MVHEASGLPEHDILYRLAYARGLQYQNVWRRANIGLRLFKPSDRQKLVL